MKFSYKTFFIILFLLIIGAGIGTWAYLRFGGEKVLELISPNGGEKLQAGKKYQIAWKAKNIGKVAIELIKGEDSKWGKWLVKDVSGGAKKYDWEIFVWEATGDDYKLAIFEYPWQEGNKIDYSDETFKIIGPQFASCDQLSIASEWPFVPNDYPGLRKVFITKQSWTGNLEGLEGADKKCQEEAKNEELEGDWKAFLGDDQNLAVDRLKLDGILVQAQSAGTLPEGKNCHRLLGKNFEDFFKKMSSALAENQGKFAPEFLADLTQVWLGRINKESKRECTPILSKYPPLDPGRGYSFTTTCQNWTTSGETVPGYPASAGEKPEFPKCYTPQGVRLNAVGLAGLSSGILEAKQTLTDSLGKSCNFAQKLICVQQ